MSLVSSVRMYLQEEGWRKHLFSQGGLMEPTPRAS